MIVKIEPIHYPILIEIWESAVLATHHFLSNNDFLYYKEQLPQYFTNVTLYGFQERLNSPIIGFLGVSEDKIEMLFVHDNCRGRGFGKELLLFAINTLSLKLIDVNEQNTNALSFYEHFGFNKVGYSNVDSEGKPYPIVHLRL